MSIYNRTVCNCHHFDSDYVFFTRRTGKIGGAKSLASSQAASLERQQVAEFKKRYRSKTVPRGRLPGQYAGQSSDSRAELVLCLDTKGGNIIGCAGVEGQ